MRANFFIAAIVFAIVSSAQAHEVSPKQVETSISDSGRIVVDCSQFPEKCHIEEGRSESSTDAAEDADRFPSGLLGGLLRGGRGGRGGRRPIVRPPMLGGVVGSVGGQAGMGGSADIGGSAGIGGGLGGGAVGGVSGSAGGDGSASIGGSAGIDGGLGGTVGDAVGGVVDGLLAPVVGDGVMY